MGVQDHGARSVESYGLRVCWPWGSEWRGDVPPDTEHDGAEQAAHHHGSRRVPFTLGTAPAGHRPALHAHPAHGARPALGALPAALARVRRAREDINFKLRRKGIRLLLFVVGASECAGVERARAVGHWNKGARWVLEEGQVLVSEERATRGLAAVVAGPGDDRAAAVALRACGFRKTASADLPGLVITLVQTVHGLVNGCGRLTHRLGSGSTWSRPVRGYPR